MTEGLLRQRRNLFITCVLLWVMKYGGVSFTKFSLAGFDVEFQHPEALVLSIWIAYAYFFYRYYQYFSSEGIEKLKSVFADAFNRKCDPIIRSLVKRQHPYSNEAVLYSFAFLKISRWVYRGQNLIPEDDGSIREAVAFEQRISPWALSSGIVRATFDSVFRNNVVTDYLLPFAFAAYVLWYCGSADWPGSFMHFILP